MWLDNQWNRPDRSDNYLMQIAAEVRRVLHKNPNKVKQKHFHINFVNEGEDQKPKMTRKQAAAAAKSRWLPWVGLGNLLKGKKDGG